jgi:hypothetical protein
MTRRQILVAGAILAVAAAAYAQTRDHGFYGEHGNAAAFDQGGDRDARGEQNRRYGNRWEAGSGDRWTIGDWTVDGDWERGKSRYSLTASAPPDDLHGPDLFLRCRDGKFDLTFIDEGSRLSGLYAVLVMTNRSAPGIVLRARRGDPEWLGNASVEAASAEHALANARKIYVRLRYERGGDKDYSYDFKDLAIGKPQLYSVCPPPPRGQWTDEADVDGGRRHGRDWQDDRDRYDGYDRYDRRDRHWRPQWPQPPINPPRVRSLTQEQNIRDQHKKATGR